MDDVIKGALQQAGFKKVFGLAEMADGKVIFVDFGCDWLSRAGMLKVLDARVDIELKQALTVNKTEV